MCTLTFTTAISVHTEAHFVSLWVGVEWWRVPLIIAYLVLFNVCHGQLVFRLVRQEETHVHIAAVTLCLLLAVLVAQPPVASYLCSLCVSRLSSPV